MADVSDTRAGDSHAGTLSAAARARMERNRLRARVLQDARLVHRARAPVDAPAPAASAARALDSGGGFLLEPDAPAAPPRLALPPAPVVHERDQPHCLRCERPFPQSYLFDTFDYAVCDPCREADAGADGESESELELVTRTEAKSEYLLQDCDLDKRPPALRAERRRNPHRAGGADMRLYLRAQLAERALLVWGSRAALQEARARREERRARTRGAQAERRVRALRRDVRSALFVRESERARARARHEHRWGPERREGDADADTYTYTRACLDCGHEETYEKM